MKDANKSYLTFPDLPDDQREAIITLRDNTTYLWPKFEGLVSYGGNNITCGMRTETLELIERGLKILSGAGFFRFEHVAHDLKNQTEVITLHVLDVSSDFKSVIESVSNSSSDRPNRAKKSNRCQQLR